MSRTRAGQPLGVLITPGAGTDAAHPSIVEIERALLEAIPHATVRRIDFPYRLAGRKAPDRAPVLIKAVGDAVDALCADTGLTPDRIVIGGRSMGGRMCSMAVAEGLAARALFCISYPLHPPGRPERMRTEHFPLIPIPTLFVSGTRDAFGTPAELGAATATITAPFEQRWIEGGDHSLTRQAPAAAAEVASWIAALGPLTPQGRAAPRRRD